MQGFSHSGSAEWDLRLHLNEALTILPFRGWSGRQLSTSGFTGSFSPLLERVRSFAICNKKKLKVSLWIHLVAVWTLMPRTNSWGRKGIFLCNDKHTGKRLLVEITAAQQLALFLWIFTLFIHRTMHHLTLAWNSFRIFSDPHSECGKRVGASSDPAGARLQSNHLWKYGYPWRRMHI